jgi:hypothetical protein
MVPFLNATILARRAHARSMMGDDEEEQQRTEAALNTAADTLVARLNVFNRNRNRVTGDRTTPRKARAGAAQAVSNEEQLLELQSMRRGVLALVEVGKLVSSSIQHCCSHLPRMLTAVAVLGRQRRRHCVC